MKSGGKVAESSPAIVPRLLFPALLSVVSFPVVVSVFLLLVFAQLEFLRPVAEQISWREFLNVRHTIEEERSVCARRCARRIWS